MATLRIPYSGDLLVAHLAAYGLAVVADANGMRVRLFHDPESLSFDPLIEVAADIETLAEAAAESARGAEGVVEADIDPGLTGNNRKPVIWARASYSNDPDRAISVTRRRNALLEQAEAAGDRIAAGLLAGMGASAIWGGDSVKPAEGATALDGVLGNIGSDFVRGLLRRSRVAAAGAAQVFADVWRGGPPPDDADRTGWAPPGTRIDLPHQWLAALGLALLPVAHRPLMRSATPATWVRSAGAGRPSARGVTLPLLSSPTSLARLRGLLAAEALTRIRDDGLADDDARAAAAVLRPYGIEEAVVFIRRSSPGAGSSVAFTFERGKRVGLR